MRISQTEMVVEAHRIGEQAAHWGLLPSNLWFDPATMFWWHFGEPSNYDIFVHEKKDLIGTHRFLSIKKKM